MTNSAGPATAPARRLGLRWSWAFLPFLVIGLGAIPNAVMLCTARATKPTLVEDRPWLRSAGLDRETAAAATFAAHGGGLTAMPEQGGLRLTLAMPASAASASELRLHCWRPSDPASDRDLPALPGTQRLGLAPGAWRIFLRGRDGVLASVLVEIPPATAAP